MNENENETKPENDRSADGTAGERFTPETIEDFMLFYGVDADEAAFIKAIAEGQSHGDLVIVDADGRPTDQDPYA